MTCNAILINYIWRPDLYVYDENIQSKNYKLYTYQLFPYVSYIFHSI